jgi:GAF domain-containing protein
MIKQFFSPPNFKDDEEKNRTAKLLHQIIMASWLLPVLAFIVGIINPPTRQFMIPIGLALVVILVILMVLNQNGKTTWASYILIGTLIIILTYVNYIGAGEPRPVLLLSVIVIMTGGLLLESRGAMIAAILLALQNMVIVLLHANGIITPQNQPPTTAQNIIVITVSYLMIGLMFQLAISRIQFVINQIRVSEKNLQISNRDLLNLSTSLEQRINQRTAELQEQQQIVIRRSRQFEGIIRVSKAISATKNLQEILPQITRVISEQLGFYHVGIFLNDSANQYAVLSASNSPGGKKMLSRRHQLKIGEQGIVGYVAQAGTPRIALDVGADASYFNNPDLSSTHSEMALPLIIEDRVIGALDIQSTEANAFTSQDIEALSALADQVSLAIQNARLFDQTEKSLVESNAIQRQYIRETWSRLPKEEKLSGFRYSATGAIQLDDKAIISASENMKDKREISAPIILRGETIGTLTVQVPKSEHVGTDQVDLIKAVAERVALSAENARLFEETSRRATREHLVSDITTKIRSTTDPQEMINTAMQELQRALGATRVEIVPQKITPSPDK